MIYTELTKKALRISFEAHKDQVDKGGMPYVYHPYHVAMQMDDEAAVCAALLHDVVEDSSITIGDLKIYGFPKEVTDAVALLTHGDDTPYFDYIRRIKEDPIARRVKIADLKHNSNISRMSYFDHSVIERINKYNKALDILTSDDDYDEYGL